jgi:hypothetical protein
MENVLLIIGAALVGSAVLWGIVKVIQKIFKKG